MVFFSVLLGVTHAQKNIVWTNFEDLNDSLREEAKPLIIFIHTDWCKYCKMQENTTFKDKKVVDNLNQNYYCLRLNAEAKEDIIFLNKIYQGKPDDYHTLAIYLFGENKPTFPTIIFFSEELLLKDRFIGYYRPSDFFDKIKAASN